MINAIATNPLILLSVTLVGIALILAVPVWWIFIDSAPEAQFRRALKSLRREIESVGFVNLPEEEQNRIKAAFSIAEAVVGLKGANARRRRDNREAAQMMRRIQKAQSSFLDIPSREA